jgi:hypothetical protein
MLRKLAAGGLPKLPEVAANPGAAIEQAIATSPLAPVQAFWASLREMRAWWPLLIPLLLWVFWRTYQRERANVLAESNQS